jgi:hypothetical protein
MKMVASPEIRRVVEIIDQRIQSLQTIKKMLINEFFGEQPQLPFSNTQNGAQPASDPKKATRKELLIKFLKAHGPMVRGDIAEGTGFPRGTLAFTLNDKETFERDSEGRWRVKPGI